jgi:hypothetical protein
LMFNTSSTLKKVKSTLMMKQTPKVLIAIRGRESVPFIFL